MPLKKKQKKTAIFPVQATAILGLTYREKIWKLCTILHLRTLEKGKHFQWVGDTPQISPRPLSHASKIPTVINVPPQKKIGKTGYGSAPVNTTGLSLCHI